MSNYDKYGYRQLLHAVEGQAKIDDEQTSQEQQGVELQSVPVQVDREAPQNQTTKNEPENPESESSQCPKLYVFISLFVVILIGFFAFRTLLIQNDSVIIKDVKIQCSNSLPSMNLMARGVDIATFDTFPSNVRKTNNFRDALFEFTCDQNRTWTSPTGGNYNLADQVKTIQTIPNKPVYIKTSLIDDLTEFKKLRAAELGIETEAYGAFSMSNAFAEMVKQITISSKRVVEAWTSVSVFKINLLQTIKNIQPSEAFLDFINNELPHHFEDGPEMYHKFIDTFGTHYFVSAKFGGIIYEETHLDSGYLFKTNESHILSQVKAKLLQQTTNLPQEGKKQVSVDEHFIANSQTQLYHYGGLADLINDHDDTNNLAMWSDSVYESPWLFSGKLISIDNLITNSSIKSQVKKAIAHHLTKTYFKELKNVVDLMKINLTETELNALKTGEKYLNGPKLEQNELNKIKQNIDDWFVRLQDMKDRALLQEYYDKMANFWNTTVACKYSVATTCKTSALHDELPRQLKTWNSLKVDQIEKILKQSLPPDSKEVVELVQEAIKLMTYHETTTVDLCADDIECQECLEATVNLLYSSPNVTACKNPIEWQNLKYNPKLNNRKNRMRTEYNNLISINANKIKCNNIVPGISRMSRGVDITTLDLYPADIKKKDGFRSVLFDLSCSHNHLWTHPTIDNYQYSLPDQIAGINTLSTGSRTVKMSCHQNLQEFKESLGHSVSLGISLGGWGSFSASYSYNEAKEQIIKSDKSISEASTHISTLQVDFHSSEEMQPSQSFLNYIYKKLPDKYEDNPDIYHEFVHKFGTHYFESANFGGLIYQRTVIQNSYLYKTDEKDLSMNLQANFLASAPIGLDFDAKYATKSSSLDEQFKSNTDTSESYYGGKPDLANHEDSSYLSRWMETVYKDPWLFSGKLVPIESLISDQTIQGEVKKAISLYRTKAFLKDFRDTLSMGKFNVSLETMTYLAKIESYLDNPTLAQYNGTFDKIGNDIDDLFGQVQEMRDRALLQEYYDKMVALWNSIFKCKYGIAKRCKSSPLHDELIRQRNAWFYIMDDKIGKALSRNTRPKSKDISDLIRQATKLLHYHETKVVDLCQGKKECQSCLEWNADCWYSEERNATALSCHTEAAWKIIQYRPKKRLIIYGESDRYCN